MTDDNLDRCNRNERKIDSLSNKVEAINDKQLRVEIKIDGLTNSLNQIVLNDLKHKAERGNVLLMRNKKDIAIAVAVIGGMSAVVSAIIHNLDTIIRFLTGG